MPKRSPLPLLTAPLLAWSATSAAALGFGAAPASAVLGAPLDFRVAIRLEPSESLDTACVAATVTSGQNLVPPETVDIALEGQGGQRVLRVKTNLVITEPLVTVTVSAGCSSRVTRRFTLFADPPGHRIIPLPQPPSVQALAQAAAGRVPVGQPAAAGSGSGSGSGNPQAQAASPSGSGGSATAAAAAAPSTVTGGAAGTAQPPAPAPDPSAPPMVVAQRDAAPGSAAASPEAEIRRPPSRVLSKIRVRTSGSTPPALKLEAPQISPTVVAAAALAEREAAAKLAEETAAAAKAAAAAAESRAAALERSVAALQQQLKAQRDSIEQLTLSLRSTQSYGLPWPWMAGVALLALLSLWLYVRLRRARREAEGWWAPAEGAQVDAETGAAEGTTDAPAVASTSDSGRFDDAAAPQGPAGGTPRPPTAALAAGESAAWPSLGDVSQAAASPAGSSPAPAPLPSLALDVASAAGASPAPLPALEMAPDAEEVPQSERTQLMPSGTGMSAPLRAVSIEELLDLEQQVEFFTVLGQDDAAIGLLVDHLRHTGGTYPLPYLKLMEFYRRRGDGEAYERIRDRFNGRFNAVAPAWGAAKGSGRSLEDYPEVLQQITPVWKRPVDAMALLENMLFRTQAGAMFDLPALSDVLFLFTLARDLHEHESGGASDVDVLLPLDGEPTEAGDAMQASAPLAASGVASMPGDLDGGFIASKPMDLQASSQGLDFDLTTSGEPDDASVAVVDLEFDAPAGGDRAPGRSDGLSLGQGGDRIADRDSPPDHAIDIPLDAPVGLPSAGSLDAVPERADSGYFDLPPLSGASRAGLAPLPAPGGGQRRSDPPMDLDIPLDEGGAPAASHFGSGRGVQAAEPSVDLSFDIDLPLADEGGSRSRSSDAAELPPGASKRLELGDPTGFNLGLMDLAPLEPAGEASQRPAATDASALDLDLPLSPPTPGRR